MKNSKVCPKCGSSVPERTKSFLMKSWGTVEVEQWCRLFCGYSALWMPEDELESLRHRRTIPHARLGGQFAPQMRCKTLQYAKYSCGFAPFCGTNFRANPHALNDAVMP